MAYASLDDFKTRLGSSATPPGLYEQLTDRLAATTADDEVGQEILYSAHGQLNTYLAERYTIPVDVSADPTLAEFLKDAVLVLAEYRAWQSHPMRQRMPDRVADALKNLVSLLNRIADGKAALPGQAEVPEAATDGPTAVAFGSGPTFTPGTLEGY